MIGIQSKKKKKILSTCFLFVSVKAEHRAAVNKDFPEEAELVLQLAAPALSGLVPL